MAPLLAEDLLLLLLDDERGTLGMLPVDVRIPLGAAVLAELALDGAVRVEGTPSRWRAARIEATGLGATDPVLSDALAVVAERPRGADDLANRVGKGLRDRLAARLAERGMLERRDDTVLGLFPRTRWPARSAAHEVEVRAALRDVLIGTRMPDPRTAVLAGILGALDRIPGVTGLRGAEARAAKRRAKEVAEGDWASAAVGAAVRSAVAATAAAVTVAAASSAT